MKTKTSTLDQLCNIEYGDRVTRKKDGGNLYPVYGGGGKTFFIDKTNRKNRVIISRFGMSEKCTRYIDGNFFLNDSGLTLSPKKNNISQYFLDNVILSLNDLIYKMGRGTAQKNLDIKQLKLLKITYPISLSEQKIIIEKIKRNLTNIDKIINLTRNKIIEINKLYLNLINEEFFSDNKAEICKLRDISVVKGGKRIPKGQKLINEKTKYPYIRVSDFTENGSINEKDVKFISEEIFKKISRYTISHKDVYISIAGTIGKSGIVPESLDKANLTENAAKIILNDKCDRDYLYFFTTSKSFKNQTIEKTRTAAQPKLALKRLEEIELPLYPKSVQIEKVNKMKSYRKLINTFLEITYKTIKKYQDLRINILYDSLNKV